MCLYSFDVVEVWLPVLDNAVVAGGNEPVLVVGIGGCPYCNIMCLVKSNENSRNQDWGSNRPA